MTQLCPRTWLESKSTHHKSVYNTSDDYRYCVGAAYTHNTSEMCCDWHLHTYMSTHSISRQRGMQLLQWRLYHAEWQCDFASYTFVVCSDRYLDKWIAWNTHCGRLVCYGLLDPIKRTPRCSLEHTHTHRHTKSLHLSVVHVKHQATHYYFSGIDLYVWHHGGGVSQRLWEKDARHHA